MFSLIKNALVHQLPWLVPSAKNFELHDQSSKRYNHHNRGAHNLLPKNAITHDQFHTFILITLFLILIVIISIKWPKDDDDDDDEDDDVEVDEVANATQAIDYTTSNEVDKNSKSVPTEANDYLMRYDYGDTQFTPRIDQNIGDRTNTRNHNYLKFQELIDGETLETELSIKEIITSFSPNYHHQIQRRCSLQSRVCRRPSKPKRYHNTRFTDYESFVRRTRSGLIYGKYPLTN